VKNVRTIGLMNHLRVMVGRKPVYSQKQLDRIAGRGLLASGKGVVVFTWQSTYDAFIDAGLDKEQAKKETDARVLIID
jgi:hypothetical protein